MAKVSLAHAILGPAALYVTVLGSARAMAEIGEARATAVIREAIAIRTSGEKPPPNAPPIEHSTLTVIRPCDTGESHKLCAIVTIEMH
jgi:hypothetical protein